VHDEHGVGLDRLLLGLLIGLILAELGELADLAAVLALGSESLDFDHTSSI
jgi:hypothetical protein